MAFTFTMQTVAANLGGMLTTFGNPQNLYLYNKFRIPTSEFFGIMIFPTLFSVLLIVVAVLTKIVGCGLGAKLCKYKPYQCKRIGVGMISRGEVALIVASKGESMGLLGTSFLAPVIIMVVVTTIITPILLKIVFKQGPEPPIPKEEEVSSFYEEAAAVRGE